MDIKPRHAGSHDRRERRIRPDGEFPMMDVLMVIIALGFFALSVGYAYACDRL
jgi:hypothetical protein